MKLTKDYLEQAVRDLISSKNAFIPTIQVARELGFHRSVFTARGVDIESINNSLGFFRKGFKPKSTLEEKQIVLKDLIDKYSELIKREGKSVSLYKFAKSIGRNPYTIYKSGMNVGDIHESCGISYDIYDSVVSDETIEKKLRELILEKDRYIPRDEIANAVGLSGPSISLRKINVALINKEYGFIGDNKSFEMMVGEWLSEIFPTYDLKYQKTFPDCKFIKTLRFDFFVEEIGLLVEVDGSSHHAKNSHWYSEEVVKRDAFKNQYAKGKGLHLLRIKVSPKLSKEKVEIMLSGIPLKHSVGQPAAEPLLEEGPETIRKE